MRKGGKGQVKTLQRILTRILENSWGQISTAWMAAGAGASGGDNCEQKKPSCLSDLGAGFVIWIVPQGV